MRTEPILTGLLLALPLWALIITGMRALLAP